MPSQEDEEKLTCEHLTPVTFGEAREAVIKIAAEIKSRCFQDLTFAKIPVAILISTCPRKNFCWKRNFSS